MRYLVLLALFILGAVAGMATTPLLSDGARQQVADFQQEVRYATGRDDRPTVAGDVAASVRPHYYAPPDRDAQAHFNATPHPNAHAALRDIQR